VKKGLQQENKKKAKKQQKTNLFVFHLSLVIISFFYYLSVPFISNFYCSFQKKCVTDDIDQDCVASQACQ